MFFFLKSRERSIKIHDSPAISFSAVRASHLSSRYLWSSLSDLIRRSIFGSKNFRNILLALAEINLKSFGVRLIGNDELCHAMNCLKRKSSIFAACQGRHPESGRMGDGRRRQIRSARETNRTRGKENLESILWEKFVSKTKKMGEICSEPREEFQVPRQFETLRRRRRR